MYIYVQDNQVVGYTDSPDQLPSGFDVYEYQEFTSLESLYFDPDSKQIGVKSTKPSDNAYWDCKKARWKEVEEKPPEQPKPYESFRETETFKKARTYAARYHDVLAELTIALYADGLQAAEMLEESKNRIEQLIAAYKARGR